jgi:hypothetical protein
LTFVTALALGIALLVAAPILAHRLRRRRADERPFPAARLVPPAPPQARKRSKLEDRGLLAVRAASVLALALLGATPFVTCSRLSIGRTSGASVALAIVVDDSMSMRARTASGKTRFERAKEAASELCGSASEGDSIAIVLAGSPPRVALAATTDVAAAREAVLALVPEDRGTDLEGAIAMARSLVDKLPQVDRRVVVLSDLADGHAEGAPLGGGEGAAVWFPLAELAADAKDCAVLSADRTGARVTARVACSPGASAQGRELLLRTKDVTLAHVPAPAGASGEATLDVPEGAGDALEVRLGGDDAIATDDAAPVLVRAEVGAIGVVADAESERVATGGPPVVEQALSALKLDLSVRPLPAAPDRAEDLSALVGLVLDDPAGLPPEERRALATYLEKGGVVLLALGPRAAAAPLGATLEPMLGHAPTWSENDGKGAKTSGGPLAEAAETLSDLDAKHRVLLAPEDAAALETLLEWDDGKPLVARRTVGRGEAWMVTLPFSVDASDLGVRPGFLALLDAWVERARARSAPRRTEVGRAWAFERVGQLAVVGPAGPVATQRDGATVRAVPGVIGAYRVTLDGTEELRVAMPAPAELDMRPRAAAPSAKAAAGFDTRAKVDATPAIAAALLALLFLELALRARARQVPSGAEG